MKKSYEYYVEILENTVQYFLRLSPCIPFDFFHSKLLRTQNERFYDDFWREGSNNTYRIIMTPSLKGLKIFVLGLFGLYCLGSGYARQSVLRFSVLFLFSIPHPRFFVKYFE